MLAVAGELDDRLVLDCNLFREKFARVLFREVAFVAVGEDRDVVAPLQKLE